MTCYIGVGPEPAATAAFHAVHLVKALTELLPDWLPLRPHVYAALLDRWRSEARRARCRNEGALEQAQLLETKRLAQCLLHYIDKHHEEAPVLLEVASVYEVRGCAMQRVSGQHCVYANVLSYVSLTHALYASFSTEG